MTSSFNTSSGHQATYYVSPSGNVMVNVESASTFKFRAVYVGASRMQFMWVSSGKSSHWQFTPTLENPTPAQTSQDPQSQNLSVDLGNRLFPAVGIIRPNVTGEILVPAIHFDIPYAVDLWVFLFRSVWFPMKITFDKSPLNISHDSAQASAELQFGLSGFGGEEDTLKAFVSTSGEGFKKVSLNLKRKIGTVTLDQKLGEIASGTETFNWKPTLTRFETILIANSNMYQNQFVDFLRSLGAQTKNGFFSGSYLQNTFFLGDAPAVKYTLALDGEKGFLSHSRDETAMHLSS